MKTKYVVNWFEFKKLELTVLYENIPNNENLNYSFVRSFLKSILQLDV